METMFFSPTGSPKVSYVQVAGILRHLYTSCMQRWGTQGHHLQFIPDTDCQYTVSIFHLIVYIFVLLSVYCVQIRKVCLAVMAAEQHPKGFRPFEGDLLFVDDLLQKRNPILEIWGELTVARQIICQSCQHWCHAGFVVCQVAPANECTIIAWKAILQHKVWGRLVHYITGTQLDNTITMRLEDLTHILGACSFEKC